MVKKPSTKKQVTGYGDEILALARVNYYQARNLLDAAYSDVSKKQVLEYGKLLLADSILLRIVSNIPAAIQKADEAIAQFEKAGSLHHSLIAYCEKIKACVGSGKHDEAAQALPLAQGISEQLGTPRARAFYLCMQALYMANVIKIENALEKNREALDLLESLLTTDDDEVYDYYVFCHLTYFICFRRSGMQDEFKQLYNKLIENPYFHKAQAMLQNAIYSFGGLLALDEKRYNDAIAIYNQTLKITEYMPVPSTRAAAYLNIGEAYYYLGQPAKALRYYHLSIKTFKSLNLPRGIGGFLRFLPKAYLALGKINIARRIFKQAIKATEESGTELEKRGLLYDYATFLYQTGDYKNAYDVYYQYSEQHFEDKSHDFAAQLERLNEKHMLEQKAKDAELLKKDLEFKNRELNLTATFLNRKAELVRDLQSFVSAVGKKNYSKAKTLQLINEQITAAMESRYEQTLFTEKLNTTGNAFITSLRTLHPAITAAEAKVATLLKDGMNTKEVANLLVISERTAENHRLSLRRKLNMKPTDNFVAVLNRVGH